MSTHIVTILTVYAAKFLGSMIVETLEIGEVQTLKKMINFTGWCGISIAVCDAINLVRKTDYIKNISTSLAKKIYDGFFFIQQEAQLKATIEQLRQQIEILGK